MEKKEKNLVPHSSLVTEVTDNKPVFDKYFTAHTIAICRPDFCGNI
jgi:hypothetical protein